MTFQQFIDKWLGKKADFDGAYGGQCVDLARFYWKEVTCTPQPKGVNGAADFWTNYPTDPALNKNFDRIDNTPTGVPKNGDVMIWNKNAGGGFGHISIFIDGTENIFRSFDQNWPRLNECTITEHGYKDVLGWFHPKLSSTQEPMNVNNEDLQTILTHYKVKSAQEFIASNDQQLQYLTDARNQIAGMNSTLEKAQLKFSTFVQNIVDKLNPIHPIAGMVDETVCLGLVDELVTSVSQTQAELKNQQKIAQARENELVNQNKELNSQIVVLKKQAESLQLQVNDLKKGIEQVQTQQQTQQTQVAQNNVFKSFIDTIINLFKESNAIKKVSAKPGRPKKVA